MRRANVTVEVPKGESIEKTIRRFNKKCEKLQVISDIKKKHHYIKPSDAKKDKRKKSIKAQRKITEREKVYY